MMITHNEFQAMRLDAEAVFAALYLIDVAELDDAQLEQHKNAMASAYLALMNLENTEFEKLGQTARLQLKNLVHAMQELQAGVRGTASSTGKLELFADGSGILANVTRVLQKI